jgi:hypothetical protein
MKTKEEKNSLEEDIKGYHDLVIPIPLVAVSFIMRCNTRTRKLLVETIGNRQIPFFSIHKTYLLPSASHKIKVSSKHGKNLKFCK